MNKYVNSNPNSDAVNVKKIEEQQVELTKIKEVIKTYVAEVTEMSENMKK